MLAPNSLLARVRASDTALPTLIPLPGDRHRLPLRSLAIPLVAFALMIWRLRRGT